MDPLPLTGAETIHPNNTVNNVPEVVYSEAAKNYIRFRRARMVASRDTRDSPLDIFDNMPFLKYYGILKKADDQFIEPRKNKQDTSINTGTIRDKDSTLLQYAMKYDFECVAQCYDEEDDMLVELAETSEDMVTKSLFLEDWKAKAKLIYRSMIAFGTAVVEDMWVERWTIEKEFGKGAKLGSVSTQWTDKKVKTYDGCQAKLWDLRKCYFGDIRKFFMNGPQGQPFFFTVEYESYDVTKTYFGDWERWKNVPTNIVMTAEAQSGNIYSQGWTLRPISSNYCEIIRYYDPVMNEFAITINGVDMLPIMEKKTTQDGAEKTLISAFPLTAVSPSGAIPFAKYDLEPMHDSAYSKGQPGKMRVFGDIQNMFLKVIIGMFKQKAKPTMGNKSGKNFDDTVTDPATVINDLREGDLFPILPNFKGPEQGDFSLYELVNKEMDKNSVQRSFQGQDNQGSEMTATQDLNNMKSSSLDVASMFDGITYGNQQLFWLRNYNIAKNWTKPIDVHIDVFNKAVENLYRTVTTPTEGENGASATKKIIFTEDTPKTEDGKQTLEHSQTVHQRELDHKKAGNGEILLTYLHPQQYATMKLSWYYTCVPVINETDPMSYMIFAKQIGDAIAVFGAQSLNVRKLKRKFAKITGQDFDTWFISEQELQQKMQQEAEANAGTPVNGGGNAPAINTYTAHGAQPGAKPTIAKIAQGARPQLGAVLR